MKNNVYINYKEKPPREWKNKEELEKERQLKEKEKAEAIATAKLIAENIKKANQCPRCKSSQLKKFKRKNYPFGRKSKPIVTTGKKCPACGYIKINKNNKN